MAQVNLTFDLTPENLPIVTQLISVLTSNVCYATEGSRPQIEAEAKSMAKKSKAETSTPVSDTENATSESSEPKAQPSADVKPETEKAPSLTDVRALATKLSKAGKQDYLKSCFAKYGANKLSDVAEENYTALMQDLVSANE